MKIEIATLLVLGLLVASARAAPPAALSFAPARGVAAKVMAHGKTVTVKVKRGHDLSSEELQVETENRLMLSVDDYNFDGHLDFAISHTDDGMGTMTIFQIYVYSPKENKFTLMPPTCGDEFINVAVSRKTRRLTNSYAVDNRFKTCTVKY